MQDTLQTDILVIGSGLAGLAAAWAAAKRGCQVTLLTRASNPEESNTDRAQGGIIYRALAESPEQLVADILSVGGGLSSPAAARLLSREGPRLVKEILIDELGVPFDFSAENPGELDLTREAGHSLPRIVHHKDQTGAAIERAFLERVRSHPNVKVISECDRGGLADRLAPLARAHRRLSPADLRRGIRARSDDGENLLSAGQGNHSGHRRPGQRLSAYDESSRGARRWHRHGLPRRRSLHEHAVHPISPDRAAGARRLLPDFRDGARRGRPSGGSSREGIHATVPSRRLAGAARHCRARHLPDDARVGRALRLSGHYPQARRSASRTVSRHLRGVHGARHRPHARTHPGGPGGAL